MKILLGIPCLYGAGHTKEAIESVIDKPGVVLLLIDNGAEHDVKELIGSYRANETVTVIENKNNVYVNPAWNQIIGFFLDGDFDYCIIMNSDLVMQKDWDKVLKNRWRVKPDEVCIPFGVASKLFRGVDTDVSRAEVKSSGTAGVFITLNRKQAKIVYPLPEECKLWFGDEYIYTILRSIGYETVMPENLLSCHYGSKSLSRVKGVSEIIEKDKGHWEKTVKARMDRVIAKHKTGV